MFGQRAVAVLPEGGIAEEKVADFAAVGEEEKVTIGFEGQPVRVDILQGAVAFVLLVRFALNHARTTS
jgi:hypothetical protein